MSILQDNKKLLTGLGITIAAYFLVIKPILQGLGLQKTPEEIAKSKSDAVNITDIQKNLSAKGIVLSKSKAEWDQIADTIYNELYSFATDDKKDAAYQLARVKNDADAIYLVTTFGSRKEKFVGFNYGTEMALIPFVNTNLSRETINLINDNYSRKGMKFKF